MRPGKSAACTNTLHAETLFRQDSLAVLGPSTSTGANLHLFPSLALAPQIQPAQHSELQVIFGPPPVEQSELKPGISRQRHASALMALSRCQRMTQATA